MNKIAIITLYDDINFGNKLQNYATQVYFEDLGFDVETIPYWEQLHPNKEFYNTSIRFAYDVYSKFRRRPISSTEISEKDSERRRCFKSFSDQYLRLGAMVHYANLPKGFSNQYDYFITGSDQVWKCWNASHKELDFFFLKFARKEQRLTMSPSFGFNAIPKHFINDYKQGLEGFQYLSCREEEGAKLIYNLTGQKAEVILDPTMLINEQKWNLLQKKPENFCEEDYILVYALGGLPGEIKDATEVLAIKYGWSIINIFEKNSIYYTQTRPDEFIFWISHAKLIITDSFHSSLFSILFRKNFMTFFREDLKGMENRLDTLLDKFGLSDRKFYEVNSDEWIVKGAFNEEKLFRINYDEVPGVLDCERKKAAKFYEKALEN